MLTLYFSTAVSFRKLLAAMIFQLSDAYEFTIHGRGHPEMRKG